MKPSPFAYRQAESVAEAVSLLAEWDGEAKLLAGGQSLVPMLNMRLVRPGCVVDVNRIPGVDEIREADGHVAIGALARYSAIEWAPTLGTRLPLLAEVVRYVGDRQIRTRGTLGGSLAQADPTGEIPLAAIVLRATVRVHGARAAREIAADELVQGPYSTSLGSDEMITEVVYPVRPRSVSAFAECARRHGDFAVISVAAVGVPGDGEEWQSVRIGLGGARDTPFLAKDVGAITLDPGTVRDLAAACADAADPHSDVRASAEYRRHLIPIYVERVLTELCRRRRGGVT